MRNPYLVMGFVIAVGLTASACTHVSRIALLSNGDLREEDMTRFSSGPTLQGKQCGAQQSLSGAFAHAVQKTAYDTLVDVEVVTTSGVFVWNNCLEVKGKGGESVRGKGILNPEVPLFSNSESSVKYAPLRYVALEMPKSLVGLEEGKYVEAGRGRFGILYRAPQDVQGFIRELQEDAGSPALTNVDIQLMTPWCIVLFCVGGDSATGYATRPAKAIGIRSNPAAQSLDITPSLIPNHQ